MVDIFISYAREDRERVRPIAVALEEAGYSVWWDVKIPTGEEFDHVIDEALTDAKAVMVIWSTVSVNSRWVKEEAEDGLSRGRLVPVLLDPVTIPRGFRRIQASDFSSEGGTAKEAAWHELCAQLERLIGGQCHKPGHAPKAAVSKPPSRLRAMALAGVFALLAIAGLVWAIRSAAPTPLAPPTDMTPVVIGIYPTDSFGPSHKRGLHLALESRAPGISLIDLEAPIDSMKQRNAPQIISALREALRNRNVVAVVGPSVTEFAPQALAAIAESGRRPAVLLITAGPRRAIGWEDSNLPIFRVGSGLDERARQFAVLATESIERGRNLILLVERTSNYAGESYGELSFRAIAQYLPRWSEWIESGRISRVTYERGRAVESVRELEQTQIFDGDNVVFVLGIGGDYAALAGAFFGNDSPRRQASMGGWMIAYAAAPLYAQRPMQFDRLFDVTDVWRAPSDRAGAADLSVFRRIYGEVSPARRDEVVAFDSGLVVASAVRAAVGVPTAEQVVGRLRGRVFRGVAGDIWFGDNGQNQGPAGGVAPLNIVRFDPATRQWTRLPSLESLLPMQVIRPPG